MKVKEMVKRLELQGQNVLVLELLEQNKTNLFYTRSEDTFGDTFSRAMAEAARRAAIKYDVSPEQALQSLIKEASEKAPEILKQLLKEPAESNVEEARRSTIELTKGFDEDED